MESPKKRLARAFIPVLVAVTVGTIGFWLLEGGGSSPWDCLYMTIITLSTVGYGEVIPMDTASRVFASFLIIFGMGSLIYFGSTVIAVWVEFDLQKMRRKRKMQKTIEELSDHVIVCGVGTTGARVVRELVETKTPYVVVDTDEDRIKELGEGLAEDAAALLYVKGDATEDRVLEHAGIARAAGLVAALRNDKDNLYLILSSRQTNPDIRIVARATEKDAPPKMLRAGADRVVAPNLIGGMRIASEMIRPQVVEFLDIMLRDQEQATRIEQVSLPPGSPLAGRKLSETKIRKATDVLVIALRDKKGKYLYNPGPDATLTEEATLIVLGSMDSVIKLRSSVSGSNDAPPLITRVPDPPDGARGE